MKNLNASMLLAGVNAITGGEVGKLINQYEIKYQNIGKQKREQSQEIQLRKIALAQQKRERKALKKGKI